MIITPINHQQQTQKFNSKNNMHKTALTPVLKNPDTDTVSFSGLFGLFKKKTPVIPEGTITKVIDGKTYKFVKESEERIAGMKECIIKLTNEYINNPKKNEGTKKSVKATIEAYQQVINDGGYWD